MTKCSVFVETSLDGFISRTDGNLDWLNRANSVAPKGEDFGYAQFMSTMNAIVLGRTTFEQILSFGEWPYGPKPVVVLSRQLKSLPGNVPATVSVSSDDPAKLAASLSAKGLNTLYVDGGKTIQSFLAAGLINEITITYIPVLIGRGNPLFGPLPGDVELELVSSKTFDPGFVQCKYRVARRS